MNKYRLYLRVKEKLCKILNRPYMKTRLDRLRYENVKVGKNCRIFADLTLSEPYLVEIGDNVTISINCVLLTHDNSVIKFMDGTDVLGKIKIGNNCFIGANVTILPGVTLADGTIVGAGSVVCKSVMETNKVIAGNPARVISSVECLKRKYEDMVFDLTGMNKSERKIEILKNDKKMIIR